MGDRTVTATYGIEHLVDGEWHTHTVEDKDARHLADATTAAAYAASLRERQGMHREGNRVVRFTGRLVEEPAPARENTPPTATWEPDDGGDALDWSASMDRRGLTSDYGTNDRGWEATA
jgi:hypothetical protein